MKTTIIAQSPEHWPGSDAMEFPNVHRSHLSAPAALPVFLLPALAVFAIWMPFGFSLGGLVEEWGFLELFARKGVFYIVTEKTLPNQMARPLHILPQAIAFTLDPNSFLYWHVIQAAALVVKGVCAADIGFYLTRRRVAAAVLGLLTMMFPADTMQLSFRALSDNWAVALALLAAVLFLWALDGRPGWMRIALASLAGATISAALLMWEAVAGLAALPLLLVFAREGRGAIAVLRSRWDVCGLWALGVLCWLAYFATAVHAGSGYQVAILSSISPSLVPKLLGGLFTSGVYRAFWDCWRDILRIVLHELSAFSYPLICGLALAAALLWIGRSDRDANRQTALRTIVAGLVAFALGYAPLTASFPLLFVTQRTFLPAAIGGALVVLGLIELMLRDRRAAVAVSVAVLSGCFIAQLYQFDQYNRIYARAYRPVLSALATFISKTSDDAPTVVYNGYGYLDGIWDLGLEAGSAVGFMFPDRNSDRIFLCEKISGRLLPRWRGEPHRDYCRTQENSVSIMRDGRPIENLEHAAIGTIDVDGAIVTDEETELKPGQISTRAIELLSVSSWTPADSLFRRSERSHRYTCEFEYMWGYDVPCRTFGFYETEPNIDHIGQAYAWIGESEAGFIFDILPLPTRYSLLLEIEKATSEKMSATLNKSHISGRWIDARHFEAEFPSSALKQSNNVLELDTELDRKYGLSLAVKSISIAPVQ